MDEKQYEKIMDMFEVIHAENVALGRLICMIADCDKSYAEKITDEWNKIYEEVRNSQCRD